MLGVYIAIASSTVVIPVILYLILGQGADEKLTSGMKDWLTAYNEVVMAVLLLIFGFKLLGDGIGILSS